MAYMMEELMPVVLALAEKYTAFESSSVTYEKMEQLMGAVLYCIREMEQSGSKGSNLPESVTAEKMPAWKAYEAGAELVAEKVKKALALYNEMVLNFSDYGNRCLHDTVIKGLPEFFKWYDAKFAPQDTILTLDYPVREDLSGYTGIDKIYKYIECICREQEFLGTFPKEVVRDILQEYNCDYREMIENICEIVERGL